MCHCGNALLRQQQYAPQDRAYFLPGRDCHDAGRMATAPSRGKAVKCLGATSADGCRLTYNCAHALLACVVLIH